MRKIISIFPIIFLVSCGTTHNLYINLVDPVSDANVFENNHLKISFIFEPTPTLPGNSFSDKAITGVGFILTNKTNIPLKIMWDDISLIIDGQVHRIVHSGVRLIDRDKSQAPSTVPPHSFIQDHIVPVDNISFFSINGSGNWFYKELINSSIKGEHLIRFYMPYVLEGKTYFVDCKFSASKVSNYSGDSKISSYSGNSSLAQSGNLIKSNIDESRLSKRSFRFIEIKRILKKYCLIYSDENTIFKLNEIYEIVRESKLNDGKTKYNKIGSAKVKKIEKNKVVLEICSAIIRIKEGDKIKYSF